MHSRLAALVVVVVITGSSACDRGKGAGTPGARSASAGAVDSRAATPTPAAASAPAASTPAAAPGARVSASRTPQHGVFLTDASGRSLYLLEEDRGGASTCYEMCAAIWPPLLAGQATPVAADQAVRANLLGTVQRRGGGAQVTYNGHPLYYYLGDGGPGQTRGQHVEDSWGEWYLVSPNGRHVGEGSDDDRRGSGRRGRDRRGEDR